MGRLKGFIPPDSKFVQLWEWFILVMVLYNLFSVPYILSFVSSEKCGVNSPIHPIMTMLSLACQGQGSYDEALDSHPTGIRDQFDSTTVAYEVFLPCASDVFAACNTVSDWAFFVDIVLNFCTGFVPRRSSLPEYDLQCIAANYVRETFIFDAIATIPWEWILRKTFPSTADWLGLKLISMVRFIRLIKVQRKLNNYLVSPFVHLSCLVGIYLMCAHVLASTLFFTGRWQLGDLQGGTVNDFVGDSWVVNECIHFADSTTQYSVSLYWSVTTITTVGYGDIVPNTNTDKVVISVAMFFSGVLQLCNYGAATQAAVLANVALIIDRLQSQRALVNDRVKQVTAALKFYEIPPALTQKVVDSIEYYASQRYGKQDRDIISSFPDRLQTDVARAVIGEVFPVIAIFQRCSEALSRELAYRWTMMIAPPNEPVLMAGAALGHLDAVLGTLCGVNVLAKTYCTMYCLSALDLHEVLQEFPSEAADIRDRALEERSRSRDASVAKLLRAKNTARNISQAALPALEELENEHDSTGEEPEESWNTTAIVKGSEKPDQKTVVLDPSNLVASSDGTVENLETHQPGDRRGIAHSSAATRPATAGSRVHNQHAQMTHVRQQVQGMLLQLKDTTATLNALKEHIKQ